MQHLFQNSPCALLLILVLAAAQLSCVSRLSTKSGPSANSAANDQAAIDQILNRYEEATGGKEAIAAIKSYRLEGTFNLAGITGSIEGWRKDPKTLAILKFPSGGTLKKGFDGETHWFQTPVGTFTDNRPEEIAKLERDAEAYSAGKIRSQFDTMKLEHKARLSGREMHVIEGKPLKGPAEKLYFDVETGLLARWDMARRESNRTVFVKVHLDDYREVSGVQTPFKVRFGYESFNLTIQVDKLEHNIPVDDALFRKP